MSATKRLNDPRYLQLLVRLDSWAGDTSGHNASPTWSGTEAYVNGPNGRMVGSFDGSASYVNCGSGMLTNLPSTGISMGMWVIPDVVSGNDGIMSIGAFGAAHGEVDLVFNSSNISLRLNQLGFNQNYSVAGREGEVMHIMMTYDGATVICYLNGAQVINGAYSTALDYSGMSLHIGNYYSSLSLDGLGWDARLYSVALTGEEIRAAFLNGQSGGL